VEEVLDLPEVFQVRGAHGPIAHPRPGTVGLRGVQFHTPDLLPGSPGYWSLAELRALRERCDADGLRIDGLENVPLAHFWKIQRGVPGRDEQIDNYRTTIANMAAAGITMLGYNFLPTYVWRTNMLESGRGGAKVTAFDLADTGAGNALTGYRLTPAEPLAEPIGAELMWANHQYFLDAVLPVAEQHGAKKRSTRSSTPSGPGARSSTSTSATYREPFPRSVNASWVRATSTPPGSSGGWTPSASTGSSSTTTYPP
jgi:mannonate dehydratase